MKRLPRRTVLRGAGATIALPWLEAMLPGRARAADPAAGPLARSGRAKRLITVFTPNGIVPQTYWPQGAGKSFTFPAGGILEPLAKHAGRMVVLKGVRNRAAADMPVPASHPEGVFTLLTGRAPTGVRGQNFAMWRARGPSIDQALAAGPLGNTVLGTLGLGPDGADWSGTLSFDASLRPVPHVTDPRTAFRMLFSDPNATPAARAQLADHRRSVLDGALASCQRLGAKLGSDDKQRLEAHCTKLRELEQRIAGGGACPDVPAALGTANYDNINVKYEELPRIIDAFSQLVVLALECDLTNLATFVMKRSGGGSYYATFLGADFDNSNGVHEIHEMSHRVGQPEWDPKLNTIARFFMQQVATLVDRLQAVKYPDGGTLLDDALVLHGSEIGKGDHSKDDVPLFLVGGAGGAIETGRYLQHDGAPHNQVLVSVMRAMGASAAEAAAFAHPAAPGALPGL